MSKALSECILKVTIGFAMVDLVYLVDFEVENRSFKICRIRYLNPRMGNKGMSKWILMVTIEFAIVDLGLWWILKSKIEISIYVEFDI